MYGLQQLKKGFLRPKLVLRELNHLYFRVTRGEYNTRGIDVFQEDWDNLILLDTMRYDVFVEKREEFDLPGTLESRISRGSATHEFLRANVADRELHDTVYVTASPKYYKHDDVTGEFHDVVGVWREEGDESARAKPPDVTTEYVRQVAEQYPDKRLLIHYVQPHWPFIGEKTREHFAGIDVPWLDHVGLGEAKKHGITEEMVWEAYLENVDVVLPYVRELLDDLPGRTVVSADHGQLMGERMKPIPLREFGHPIGIYVDELVKVPWLVHDNGDRKQVVAEPPVGGRDDDAEALAEETLRELGYLA
jgi:hypothetical protein